MKAAIPKSGGALVAGHQDKTLLLFRHISDLRDPQTLNPSDRGFGLLHFACYFCRVGPVRYLLENGVDVNCQARGIMTSLHAALLLGRLPHGNCHRDAGFRLYDSCVPDTVKLLLDHGADRDIRASMWGRIEPPRTLA